MYKKQKEPELMKDRRITLRFNQTQYEMIERNASQAELSVSEYIRQMLLTGSVPISYEVVVAMPEIQAMARDLEGACNNLNQIAKYFNMGGLRSMQVQQDINSCVNAIFKIRDSLAKLEGNYYGDH